MRVARSVFLSLLAVFALSAVASATAYAGLPEIVNSKGELPVKPGFTSTSKKGTFETAKGEKLTCEKDKDKGKITGPKTDTVTITFEECKSSGIACNTKGSKSGVIEFEASSKLVYTNEAKKEVGEVLSPTAELTIECTALETLKVKGSLICKITPVNELTLTATLSCKQKKGVQEPTEYEEEGKKVKEITETEGKGAKSFKFEQSGLESEDTLTFEEEVEIKA